MIYKFYQQRIFPHLLNQVMQIPSMMKNVGNYSYRFKVKSWKLVLVQV